MDEEDIRDLLADDDLFDPFEDEDEEEQDATASAPAQEDETGIGAPLETKHEVEKPQLSAEERLEKLLHDMPGQKRLLLKLIDHCREAKTGEEMDEYTLELQQYCYSVYSPVVLRELLQNAGGIDYIAVEDELEGIDELEAAEAEQAQYLAEAMEQLDAQEQAAAAPAADPVIEGGVLIEIDDSKVQHETLVEDGEELTLDYLEVEERKPGLWIATEAGLAAVDSMDDLNGTRELLAQEPQYLDIYHQILDFCAQEQYGRSPKEIDNLVNDSPLLEKPRRYSGYFVSRLERQGAIEWRDGWCVTEVGQQIIEESQEKVMEAVQNA